MMKNNFWHFIKFLVGGGGQKVAPPPSPLSGAKGRTNEINRVEVEQFNISGSFNL